MSEMLNEENKNLDESYKMHYPTLKKFVEINYGDPRTNSNNKIHVEKTGNFKVGDSVIEGTYIVYEDSKMPGSYIGVHVSNELNEETDEPSVNVVAIDPNKKHVVNRVSYRMRRNKATSTDPLDG